MHEVSGAASVAIILALWVSGLSAFAFGVVLEIIRRARLARGRQAPPASGVAFPVPALGDAKSVDEAKSIRDMSVARAEEAKQAINRDSEAETVEIRAIEVVLHRRRVANPAQEARGPRVAKVR